VKPVELPHSEECERAVLAALKLDAERWLPVVEGLIGEEDFYLDRHRRIWRAARAIAAAGKPVDDLTLREQLETSGDLEEVGGVAYLATLDVDLPDLARVDAYAEIIRDRSIRRRLAEGCARIYHRAMTGEVEVPDLLEEADEIVFGLLKQQQRGAEAAIHLGKQMQSASARLEAGERPIKPGLSTGFEPLDRVTYGLRPGKLWQIAARPGKGKSTLGLQIALRAARDGAHVLIFSPEMTAEDLALRGLSHTSGVELDSIVRGRVTELGRQSIRAQVAHYVDAPVEVYEDCPTVESISVRCSLYRQRHSALDLVVVDYIQLLRPSSTRDDRRTQIAHISRGLKDLAKRLRVPVLAMCQLRRMKDDWDRPSLADLKEAGELEQDADVVLFPWADRETSSHERDIGELIVAKNRDGARVSLQTAFLKPVQTFRLLADEDAAQRSVSWRN
jgi:replicative DNA helicase